MHMFLAEPMLYRNNIQNPEKLHKVISLSTFIHDVYVDLSNIAN